MLTRASLRRWRWKWIKPEISHVPIVHCQLIKTKPNLDRLTQHGNNIWITASPTRSQSWPVHIWNIQTSSWWLWSLHHTVTITSALLCSGWTKKSSTALWIESLHFFSLPTHKLFPTHVGNSLIIHNNSALDAFLGPSLPWFDLDVWEEQKWTPGNNSVAPHSAFKTPEVEVNLSGIKFTGGTKPNGHNNNKATTKHKPQPPGKGRHRLPLKPQQHQAVSSHCSENQNPRWSFFKVSPD